MPRLAPPPAPPRVAVGYYDAGRLRRRLFQLSVTMVTLLLTAWVCTLGIIPALIALWVAKHVLVAVVVMGLGVDASAAERSRSS